MNREYDNPSRSLERAKTFIEGAFSNINLDVDANIRTQTPDPPQEEYRDVDGLYPCSSSLEGNWSFLNGWFRDWLDCKDLQPGHEQHKDVSFLLSNTNASDGGLSFPRCAHAQTGYHVADLPADYTADGSGLAFSAMETVLHELGHSFMEGTSTKYEHNSGKTDETDSTSTEYSTTPMGYRTDESSNECNDDHEYVTGSSIGPDDVLFRMNWSQCCLNEWNPDASQK